MNVDGDKPESIVNLTGNRAGCFWVANAFLVTGTGLLLSVMRASVSCLPLQPVRVRACGVRVWALSSLLSCSLVWPGSPRACVLCSQSCGPTGRPCACGHLGSSSRARLHVPGPPLQVRNTLKHKLMLLLEQESHARSCLQAQL